MKSHYFFAAMILLAMALVVAGCTKTETVQKPAIDPIRIAVPSWYSPEQVKPMAEAMQAHNLHNPDQPAEFKILIGERDALLQKVLQGARQGDLADAVLVRNEWIGRLVADGLIAPLPTKMGDTVRQQALPILLPAVSDGNQVWAFPFETDAWVIWLRKDLLGQDAAPITDWDLAAFEAQIAKLGSEKTEENGRPGFAFTASNEPNAGQAFLPWYIAFEGQFRKKNDRIVLDAPIAEKTLAWLQGLADKGLAPKTAATIGPNDLLTGLAKGTWAAMLGGTGERGMLKSQSELSDKIVALPLPTASTTESTTLVGGWSFVILKGSKIGTERMVIRMMLPAFQSRKLNGNTLLPVLVKSLPDLWFANNPDGPTFLKALKTGRTLPLSAQTPAFLEQVAARVNAVFQGKETPAKAAAKLARGEPSP